MKSQRNDKSASQSDISSNTDGAAEPAVESSPKYEVAQVLGVDEFAGKGGDYIFDPATGKRTAA